jgi:hypothetical protein
MIITSDTFRAKNITKDDGTTIFLNIKPSEYFVKPLLKEYIFNPSALVINDLIHFSSLELLFFAS